MPREMRLRSARARKKAQVLVRQTMADPAFPKTLLIAGSADLRRWAVIPGGMLGREMAEALLAAAEALERLNEHERQAGHAGEPIRLDITEQGAGPTPEAGRMFPRQTTIAADGSLQAPPGEAFCICGECGGSRWYATTHQGEMRRLVCVGCGNELYLRHITHAPGTA